MALLRLMSLSLVLLFAATACSEQEPGGARPIPPTDAHLATALAVPALSTVPPPATATTEVPEATIAAAPATAVQLSLPSLANTEVPDSQEQPKAASTSFSEFTTALPTSIALLSPTPQTATAVPNSTPRPSPTPLPETSVAPSRLPEATANPLATATAVSQLTVTPVQIATTAVQSPTPTASATSADEESAGHFSTCVSRTGGNATIAVPADIAFEGGVALNPGDEIAVFTPDGSICAGIAIWTDQNIAITAWGDDSQTEVLDGLREGEQMRFKIWRKATAKEIPVQAITYSLGDGLYVTDSLHAIEALTIVAN